MRVDLLANMGAYMHDHLAGHPDARSPGCTTPSTRWRHYDFTCTGVFTTTTPTDAYRGAGRPEATYAVERLMDDLAADLGHGPDRAAQEELDRARRVPLHTRSRGLDLRQRQLRGGDRPGRRRCSTTTGCGPSRSDAATPDDPVQLGIGISTFTEMCGLAPSRILSALKYVAGGWEHATVRVLPTGKVEVVTGTSPHGQGHVTACEPDRRRPARHRPVDDIEVIHGDTLTSRRSGMDTYGSRSLAVGGMAVRRGRRAGRGEGQGASRRTCSRRTPADLEFRDGTFRRQGLAGCHQDDPGGRVRGVQLARPARRRRAHAAGRLHRRPADLLATRTAPTCAPSRSTPRPA